MFDFLALLEFVLTGNWFVVYPLVFIVLSPFVLIVVVTAVWLYAWPRYDAWLRRKNRLIARDPGLAPSQLNDFMKQHTDFKEEWKGQPMLGRLLWMVERRA